MFSETAMNKEYKKLTNYLYEILHNLQNQSRWLQHKDIAICLSDEKNRTDNKADFTFSQKLFKNLSTIMRSTFLFGSRKISATFEQVNAPKKQIFVMKNATHGLLESRSEEFSGYLHQIAAL